MMITTTIDNFNPHTFLMVIENDNYRKLLGNTLAEYVRLLKRAVYDYTKYRLARHSDNNKTGVQVLHGNHRIARIGLSPGKGTATTRLKCTSMYGNSGEPETISRDYGKLARALIASELPTVTTEAMAMRDRISQAINLVKHAKEREAKDACTKAENMISDVMYFNDIDSALMRRVVSVASMEILAQDAFKEWVETGAIELTREYYDIKHVVRRATSGYSHCGPDAYVKHWSDGSGVLITGNERHELDNAMEQLPIDLAEKLAVLKVSGLSYIAGVGVSTEPLKVHDGLEEHVYFLLRD